MPRFVVSLIVFCAFALTVAWAQERYIILQSTTSTVNSGLLDHILPRFTDATGIGVRVVAAGTGQALKNAANGDGDAVLVHARHAEDAFVADGFAVERFDVMYNDFVVVGPEADPAGIRGSSAAIDALHRIAKARLPFLSRGDNSGTHKKERALWRGTGVDVDSASGTWYREAGAGMGATLNTAAGMGAYTLSDRATWLAFNNKADLVVMVEGDERLFNPYGIMAVNPEKHPHVKADDARIFIDWLVSPPGQAAIASYRLDGRQLFFPNAQDARLKQGKGVKNETQ